MATSPCAIKTALNDWYAKALASKTLSVDQAGWDEIAGQIASTTEFVRLPTGEYNESQKASVAAAAIGLESCVVSYHNERQTEMWMARSRSGLPLTVVAITPNDSRSVYVKRFPSLLS